MQVYIKLATAEKTRDLQVNSVVCDKCDKVVMRQKLKRHRDEVHRELQPFQCATCRKKFKRHYLYSKHLRTCTRTVLLDE